MTPFFKALPKADRSLHICWLRRDLRLEDHHALSQALETGDPVLCLFIFDQDILDKLDEKKDRRLSFIADQLESISQALKDAGSDLLTGYGNVGEVWEYLLNHLPVQAVYANEDYEPYARKRDDKVARLLRHRGIPFYRFPDQLIFSPGAVLKEDGNPYTVYTPFQKKWKKVFHPRFLQPYPSLHKLKHLYPVKPLPSYTLEEVGFSCTAYQAGPPLPEADLLKNYAALRNFPAEEGTSRIGAHLRFGTVSIRQIVERALHHSEIWLNELIWREFFMHILHHFTHLPEGAFKPAYDRIQWRKDAGDFEQWCQGRTGYPLVDAGMRQLNETGFMHNRVRMVTASFLVKHLLLDWRWGEAWFAAKLLDFELSSNNGNWQWAAGSGCDAAPYFRIFNPDTQQKKFDPQMKYIRQYVPEVYEDTYPLPMVEHRAARARCLQAYRAALEK